MSIRKFLSVGLIAFATFALAACTSDKPVSTQAVEQEAAVANQQRLIRDVPIPTVTRSLERVNLAKRAERVNSQNLASCITLFSVNGSVVAFFPVDGKVSSLNSYMQSGDQMITHYSTANGTVPLIVEAPDIDGAYGQNADGIFFFTADTNAYVEWTGDYFWSDQCLKPASAPLLIQAEQEVPASTALPDVTVTPN